MKTLADYKLTVDKSDYLGDYPPGDIICFPVIDYNMETPNINHDNFQKFHWFSCNLMKETDGAILIGSTQKSYVYINPKPIWFPKKAILTVENAVLPVGTINCEDAQRIFYCTINRWHSKIKYASPFNGWCKIWKEMERYNG